MRRNIIPAIEVAAITAKLYATPGHTTITCDQVVKALQQYFPERTQDEIKDTISRAASLGLIVVLDERILIPTASSV